MLIIFGRQKNLMIPKYRAEAIKDVLNKLEVGFTFTKIGWSTLLYLVGQYFLQCFSYVIILILASIIVSPLLSSRNGTGFLAAACGHSSVDNWPVYLHQRSEIHRNTQRKL